MSAARKELSFGANAALNVSSWFVPALTALIAVPITVRGLGADSYGLLTLVSTLTGFLGLMELGLGTAIVRNLSYYHALNEGRPMLGIIRFAAVWFGVVGLVGGVVLFAGAQWFAQSLLKLPPDMVPTAVVVIRISAFGFFTGMLVSVGSAIPSSFLRYDLTAVTTIVFGVLGSAGPAILVLWGQGLVAIVAYGVATSVLALLAYAVIGVRLFRPVDKSAGPSWRSIRRQTLRFAGVAGLNQIHGVVASQASRVVVGVASSVAAAAYYQVPSMLASRVGSMLQRAAQVIFPTASGMRARNDADGVKRLYLRTSRLFFVVNGSVSMAMCALAHPLLALWVSPKYAQEGAAALAIFSVTSAINATTMSASYMNLASLRPGVNLTFSFSNSAIALATVYPLTVHWGVTGASLAGLLGALNVPAFFWYVHKNTIHVSSRSVWRTCYRPTVIGNIPVGVGVYLLVAPRLTHLIGALAAFACATLVGIAVSGLLGAIKREDVRAMMALIRGIWHRPAAPPADIDGSAGDTGRPNSREYGGGGS